jgi:hypothetical protein
MSVSDLSMLSTRNISSGFSRGRKGVRQSRVYIPPRRHGVLVKEAHGPIFDSSKTIISHPHL